VERVYSLAYDLMNVLVTHN